MQEEQRQAQTSRSLNREQLERATEPQQSDYGSARTGGAMSAFSVLLDGYRVFVDRASYDAVCEKLGKKSGPG